MKSGIKQDCLFPGHPVQKRRSKSEDDAIYSAVLYMRKKANLHVLRAGQDHHSVNGERLSTQALLSRAAALRQTVSTKEA